MNQNKNIKIGFWGGPEYSVLTLDKLYEAGFTIAFVVTSLDKPKGRNLILTPPPAKAWALAHGIPVIQPESLKNPEFEMDIRAYQADVFIVMAYGRIIPDSILTIPKGKSINIHPSLLPKFRGPSPIESAILANDRDTGVTLIRMDSEMDHGPIISQKRVSLPTWPVTARELGTALVSAGADLLIEILPDWIQGKVKENPQDHNLATYTRKIVKEDGLIDLAADAYDNFLKIQAYHAWPTAYFMKDGKRIKITKASYTDTTLTIERVIPEGKREMDYKEFIR